MRRVVITGLGPATAAGIGRAFWDNILGGRSFCTRNKLFTPAAGEPTAAASIDLEEAITVASRTPYWKLVEHRLKRLEDKELRALPNRTVYMSLAASQLAIEDAQISPQLLEQHKQDIGIIIGNTCGDAASLFQGKPSTMYTALNPAHGAAGAVSMAFDLHGPSQGVASACASGNIALIAAAEKIQLGKSKIMLAGGASAVLHSGTGWDSYNRLGVLVNKDEDPSMTYRVFDEDRDGFVLGEGAAVLVLEDLEHALQRGARIYAEVAGTSQRMFPTRMMVDVNEDGYEFVIRESMEKAKLHPGDLGSSTLYMNLHGTGTQQGDNAELTAIRKVFSDSQLGTQVFASGTKPYYGHTQESSAAIESVICALSLYDGIMPGTPNLKKPIHPGDFVLKQARERSYDYAMNLAAGFAGYQTSVLFKKFVQ